MKLPTLSLQDQRTLGVLLFVCLPFLAWTTSRTQPFDENTSRSYCFQIDPNSATAIEFRLLPGIGEKLADAIILERTQQGSFKIPADLRKVKGIGPKKFETVRPFLSIVVEE